MGRMPSHSRLKLLTTYKKRKALKYWEEKWCLKYGWIKTNYLYLKDDIDIKETGMDAES